MPPPIPESSHHRADSRIFSHLTAAWPALAQLWLWMLPLLPLVWFGTSPVQAEGTIIVTVSCSGSGNISPKGKLTLPANTDLTVTATPDAGYEVLDWYGNNGPLGWGNITQQWFAFGDVDVTIYVEFQRITHPVSTTTSYGGSLSPGGNDGTVVVGWGDSVQFTATPEADYHVDTWSVDGVIMQVGGTHFTLAGVIDEHSVRAGFALDTYSLLASASEHGSLDPSGVVEVERGQNQSFTATADPGFAFAGWFVDGVIAQTTPEPFTLFTVQTNHTVRALFTQPTVPLSIRRAGNSVVVFWPASAAGWVLESTSQLGGPVSSWTQLPPPYQTNGTNLEFTEPLGGGPKFYRLRHS